MIALAITVAVCITSLLLAWWARGVVLTSIGEGQASEIAAQVRAELVEAGFEIGKCRIAHGELEARVTTLEGSTKHVESIAIAAKTQAQLNASRRS